MPCLPAPRRPGSGNDHTSGKGRLGNAGLFEGLPCRQMRLLYQPDDLKFLGGGISHLSSPPCPIMLFLSKRFSKVRPASAFLQVAALLAQSFHLVAPCRTGSVACKPLLASFEELLRPAIIQALGDPRHIDDSSDQRRLRSVQDMISMPAMKPLRSGINVSTNAGSNARTSP